MKRTFIAAVALVVSVPLTAQTGYQPTAANLTAREWFQNSRFSVFIHWGQLPTETHRRSEDQK